MTCTCTAPVAPGHVCPDATPHHAWSFQDTAFHTTERLGRSQSLTPEGFLVCEGVPIARTGAMMYMDGQTPVEADETGWVRIIRDEATVFSPIAMASYLGKPVTLDHPSESVSPETWGQLAVGTVQNVRRGSGDQADLLVADLLITRKDAISAVRSGLIEVSCGYDADYEQEAPGRGRQTNIIGNHVALVAQGRCGPRCAIGDDMPAIVIKRSLRSRILAAFHSGDEAAVAEAMKDLPKDAETGAETSTGTEIGTPEPTKGGEAGVTINIHPGPEDNKMPGTGGGSGDAEEGSTIETSLAAIRTTLERLDQRLTALEGDDAGGEGEEGSEDADPAAAGAAAGSDPKPNPFAKTGDSAARVRARIKPGSTKDSSALRETYDTTLTRAAILFPGIRVFAFDAKATAAVTVDALCGLRRRALAGADPEVVGPILDGREIGQMSCDAVGIAFDASAAAIGGRNNAAYARLRSAGKPPGFATRTATPAEMNRAHDEYWAKRGNA